MLKAVLVIALGAVVVSGVGALAERPDTPLAPVADEGVIDRDDVFDGGNG